ncbi:MAG: phosphatidate cytidylyltransferase [Bacteroidota bacterium]
MALNTQTLKTRSLSAVVFVGVMTLGLFGNAWTYLCLFSLLLIACWQEYGKLIDKILQRTLHPYLYLGWMLNGLAIAWLFAGMYGQFGSFWFPGNFVFPVHLAGFIFLIWGTLASSNVTLRHWLLAAAGTLYITIPWALTLHLYTLDPGPMEVDLFFPSGAWWAVIAIATMWVNDTMAYMLGSLIGRTLFSKISPKKTWEGTLSGILCATLLLGWVLDRCLYDESLHSVTGYVLIFSLAIAGTLGDLFESKLKRMAGVKDSGSLMPGHGGVLDRFDSFLFAIPVLYLFLRAISLAY